MGLLYRSSCVLMESRPPLQEDTMAPRQIRSKKTGEIYFWVDSNGTGTVHTYEDRNHWRVSVHDSELSNGVRWEVYAR